MRRQDKTRILPPLRAVRARCRDCASSVSDVRLCVHEFCALWRFRLGKKPSGQRGGRAVRKAIRRYCVWCSGENPQEPKRCPSIDCPLWPYCSDSMRAPRTPPYLPLQGRKSPVYATTKGLTARDGVKGRAGTLRASNVAVSQDPKAPNRVWAAQEGTAWRKWVRGGGRRPDPRPPRPRRCLCCGGSLKGLPPGRQWCSECVRAGRFRRARPPAPPQDGQVQTPLAASEAARK